MPRSLIRYHILLASTLQRCCKVSQAIIPYDPPFILRTIRCTGPCCSWVRMVTLRVHLASLRTHAYKRSWPVIDRHIPPANEDASAFIMPWQPNANAHAAALHAKKTRTHHSVPRPTLYLFSVPQCALLTLGTKTSHSTFAYLNFPLP